MEEKRKVRFEDRVKKILIGFFVLMLLFTILSRSADSMTIAKVSASTVQRGTLAYELAGTGVIKEKAEKYIRLISGYTPKSVSVEAGDSVKKGDLLFTYSLEDAKKQKENLEKELEKLLIDYEKLKLGDETSGGTDTRTAEQAVENAKEDLESAKADLEDIKASVKKKKEEDLKTQKESLESLEEDRKKAEKTADRAIEDAKTALEKFGKSKTEVENAIGAFRAAALSGDWLAITGEREKLMEMYFGDSYKEMKSKITEAAKAVDRAESDLSDVRYKWNQLINPEDADSEEESVREAYKQQIINRDAEIRSGERAVEDAKSTYRSVSGEETDISNAINAYQTALSGSNTEYIDQMYGDLFDRLYKDRKPDEAAVEDARTVMRRAEEDRRLLTEEWDNKKRDLDEKIEELENDLMDMENETYDFTEDLKDGEKAVEQAERALESAELSLSQEKKGIYAARENKITAEKGRELSLKSARIDIESKKKEIEESEKLLKEKGKVTSPVDGVVMVMEVKPDVAITGQEKCTIAVEGYYLEVKTHKDSLEKFNVEDTAVITLGEEDNTVEAPIENISAPDEEGMVTFTMLLPEGSYRVGGSLSYKLSKASATYPQTIPIGALHQDSKGTYVLTMIEKQGILGTELYAFRIAVTVVDKDYKNAAIEASLSSEDRIITSSNKNIEDGYRVRPNEA